MVSNVKDNSQLCQFTSWFNNFRNWG